MRDPKYITTDRNQVRPGVNDTAGMVYSIHFPSPGGTYTVKCIFFCVYRTKKCPTRLFVRDEKLDPLRPLGGGRAVFCRFALQKVAPILVWRPPPPTSADTVSNMPHMPWKSLILLATKENIEARVNRVTGLCHAELHAAANITSLKQRSAHLHINVFTTNGAPSHPFPRFSCLPPRGRSDEYVTAGVLADVSKSALGTFQELTFPPSWPAAMDFGQSPW